MRYGPTGVPEATFGYGQRSRPPATVNQITDHTTVIGSALRPTIFEVSIRRRLDIMI